MPAPAVLPPPGRIDGYAAIRDYAAIGDGRTVALVARDGSIDWLPFPSIDSPTVFGALLDARRGGAFVLAPEDPPEVTRRYLPGTNILETTFTTETGAVSVTDVMTVPTGGLLPLRELMREVKGLRGTVPLSWRVEPRFGYGAARSRVGRRRGSPWWRPARTPSPSARSRRGSPRSTGGSPADSRSAKGERSHRPVVRSSGATRVPVTCRDRGADRGDRRVVASVERVQRLQGRWKEAVDRSGLTLKLLFFAPTGAVAAAPTTSLPEEIGGERNWDYRLSWVRDSAFTIDALLRVGCAEEAEAFLWWLMQASQLTHPRLQVLYRLDGGAEAPERTLDLRGYRDSRPVRVGNAAADQLQLEIYGGVFEAASLFVDAGRHLDHDVAKRLAAIADLVCEIWGLPDSGIWEVRSDPVHFTQSKMMCWVALDRAVSSPSWATSPAVTPTGGGAKPRRSASSSRPIVGPTGWGATCEQPAWKSSTRASSPELSSATTTSAGSPFDHDRCHPPRPRARPVPLPIPG